MGAPVCTVAALQTPCQSGVSHGKYTSGTPGRRGSEGVAVSALQQPPPPSDAVPARSADRHQAPEVVSLSPSSSPSSSPQLRVRRNAPRRPGGAGGLRVYGMVTGSDAFRGQWDKRGWHSGAGHVQIGGHSNPHRPPGEPDSPAFGSFCGSYDAGGDLHAAYPLLPSQLSPAFALIDSPQPSVLIPPWNPSRAASTTSTPEDNEHHDRNINLEVSSRSCSRRKPSEVGA